MVLKVLRKGGGCHFWREAWATHIKFPLHGFTLHKSNCSCKLFTFLLLKNWTLNPRSGHEEWRGFIYLAYSPWNFILNSLFTTNSVYTTLMFFWTPWLVQCGNTIVLRIWLPILISRIFDKPNLQSLKYIHRNANLKRLFCKMPDMYYVDFDS